MKTDKRIDIYIDKAQAFAQPILGEIRQRVHEYCPEVEETMKWSFPHFTLNGKILCSMASFKNHCSFGFWLAPIMTISERDFKQDGMGDLGKMTSLADLPSENQFKAMILEAVELTLTGKTISKVAPKEVIVVESKDLLLALKNDPNAILTYNAFPPSQKKEYNEWILDAKTDATKEKRIAQAVEWMSEGKIRHWKYMK